MNDHRKVMAMDGVVSIPDGIAWMTELQKEPPIDLAARLAEFEPSVVGVCARQADELKTRLLRRGASMAVAKEAASAALLIGLMSLELMRRGHAKAWADYFLADDDANGGSHGN